MDHPEPQNPDTELSNCTTMSAKKDGCSHTAGWMHVRLCVFLHERVLMDGDAGLDLSLRLQCSDYSPTQID